MINASSVTWLAFKQYYSWSNPFRKRSTSLDVRWTHKAWFLLGSFAKHRILSRTENNVAFSSPVSMVYDAWNAWDQARPEFYDSGIPRKPEKKASTVLCSVVKHAGSGRAWKNCRGKHETSSSVCSISRVLYRFLSALQQNRARSRLLYLFYDKESINFPTHSAKFFFQTRKKYRQRASVPW